MFDPEFYMRLAIEQAILSKKNNEVPIGAIILDPISNIITAGHNQTITKCDISLHAEIVAMKKMMKKLKNHRLPNCILFVTMQPCLMCLGAILHSRIRTIFFGCFEKKYQIPYNDYSYLTMHGPIMENECSSIIKEFFKSKRIKDIIPKSI